MNKPGDERAWPDTVRATTRDERRAEQREELLAPSTMVVHDRDDYLGQGQHDVGRRVSDDQIELFVTGDAAPSLQREIELHATEYIAVHDVGASASLRLLAGLAGAAHAPVQKLTIRRQGYGLALAVLQFVEVPLADGGQIRVFSTDVSADTNTRQALARTLLAFSRVGVLITGEVPAHSVAAALQPLREAISRGPWPNRELLLVPLGSSAALASQASSLSAGSGVAVQITPQAIKPKHIWTFIAGAWNRVNSTGGTARAVETDIERALPRAAARAAAQAVPMTLPAGVGSGNITTGDEVTEAAALSSAPVASPRAMPSPGRTNWQGYVERCAAIKGTVGACVFDIHGSKPLAWSGVAPPADRLAQQGTALLAAAADGARALGLGSSQPEISLSTSGHHLLVRPIPGHPGVALHLVLLASAGNLTLARMQLERVEPPS
jgi:hypothetical protein